MLHSSDRAVPGKIIASLLMLAPTAALAEVSDKEPSLFYVWMVGIIASAVCFIGSYHRRWLAPILAILPALWFASFLMEIHSADVGPHLYAEQGIIYYIHAYLSLAIFVAGIIFGLLMNKRRRNF